MAYKRLNSKVFCVNSLDAFVKMRNFLCAMKSSDNTNDYSTAGIGWTLFDYSTAAADSPSAALNDWIVIRSAGENGERDMFVRLVMKSGFMDIDGFLSWNASTNVGTQEFSVNNSMTQTVSTNNYLWIYGDLDAVTIVSLYGSVYYIGRFGWMPDSPVDQSIILSTSAMTGGSTVTVDFAAVPVAWATGMKVFVSDSTNIERLNIASVTATSVTFSAAPVASYASGSKFTLERTEYVSGSSAGTIYLLIGHGGTKGQQISIETSSYSNPASGDGLSGLYPAGDAWYTSTDTWIGPLKNTKISIALISESDHTLGGVTYKAFLGASANRLLLKEA